MCQTADQHVLSSFASYKAIQFTVITDESKGILYLNDFVNVSKDGRNPPIFQLTPPNSGISVGYDVRFGCDTGLIKKSAFFILQVTCPILFFMSFPK